MHLYQLNQGNCVCTTPAANVDPKSAELSSLMEFAVYDPIVSQH